MILDKEQIDEIMNNQEVRNKLLEGIHSSPAFSSNISAIGYDDQTSVLKVIFKGNSSYLYFNVEKSIYESIANSDSKGKTLNELVIRQKEKYKYYKLS